MPPGEYPGVRLRLDFLSIQLQAQRLEGEVEERHALREDLAEIARRIGLRKLEPGIGLAGFGDDMHALSAGEVHHRLVLLQAVHEEPGAAPIACPQRGALED